MVYYMGVDVGQNTGFCVIDHRGSVDALGTYLVCELQNLRDYKGLTDDGLILPVVEYPLIIGHGEQARVLQEATQQVAAIFPNARTIRPAQWKTMVRALDIVVPKVFEGTPTTQHERDAYGIACYALANRWQPKEVEHGRPAV